MNVYFFDPRFLKVERFPVLLEILKVKRIIDLTEPNTRNPELLRLYSSDTIFIRQNSEIETATKKAVYKFIEPICKTKVVNGRFTGEFIINDLYKESNAYNPIYNLEKCNNENTFVLCNMKERVPLIFTRLSLNILRKYAKIFSYEKKLCFNIIGSFFELSACYKNKFYILKRSITTLSNHYNIELDPNKTYSISKINNINLNAEKENRKNSYNPLLSYLYSKYLNIFPKNEYNFNLMDFFLSDEGKNEWQKILDKIFILKVKKRTMIEYGDCFDEESELEAWGADSEIKYIRSNGGDWIDD